MPESGLTDSSRHNGIKDLLLGIIYIIVGGAAALAAQQYDRGTLLRMGPGYFPTLVGGLLVLLGGCSIVIGLGRRLPDPIAKVKISPILFILAGAISFALLINRAGLVIAIAALLGFACLPRLRSHPWEVLFTVAVLVSFSAGVFVYGFGISVPLGWWDY